MNQFQEVSETLQLQFEQLKETAGKHGYKYRHADVKRLSQYLVCRNYGKLCLELSYCSWAVINSRQFFATPSPLLTFFWVDENITPSLFRHAFSNNTIAKQVALKQKAAIDLTEQHLVITIGHDSFSISPTRIGVIAVLLEWLATSSPSVLSYIEETLLLAHVDAIKNVSLYLQKHIYAALKEHLPSAQIQYRFRSVSDWVLTMSKPLAQLNDEDILLFWQSSKENLGYTKFANAFHDITDFITASEIASTSQQIKYAQSIGDSNEDHEISADVLYQSVFQDYQRQATYECLIESPKFLSKSQWHLMQTLLDKKRFVKQFQLSFYRLSIMGHWQSQIIQAARSNQHSVVNKLNSLPQNNYVDFARALQLVAESVISLLSSVVHMFYTSKDVRMIGLLRRSIALKQVFNTIKDHEHKAIQSISERLNDWISHVDYAIPKEQLFVSFQSWLLQHPDINRLLQLASSDFKRNNKEGFKTIPDGEKLDNYQERFELSIEILNELYQFLVSPAYGYDIKKQYSSALETKFKADVFIFKDEFEHLHRGTNER